MTNEIIIFEIIMLLISFFIGLAFGGILTNPALRRTLNVITKSMLRFLNKNNRITFCARLPKIFIINAELQESEADHNECRRWHIN